MSEPIKPHVTFEDWLKCDLRVVTVVSAESVEGADKLIKFTVSDGSATHTVCSGVKEWYEPESLVGRQMVWLANLPCLKMRGIESNGMLLFANDGEKYVPLSVAEKIPDGARVE